MKGLCSAETFVGIARSNFQQDMDNSPMLDTETISKLIQGSRSILKILNVDFSTLDATAVRKYLQRKKLISKEYTMVDGADGRTEYIYYRTKESKFKPSCSQGSGLTFEKSEKEASGK